MSQYYMKKYQVLLQINPICHYVTDILASITNC